MTYEVFLENDDGDFDPIDLTFQTEAHIEIGDTIEVQPPRSAQVTVIVVEKVFSITQPTPAQPASVIIKLYAGEDE